MAKVVGPKTDEERGNAGAMPNATARLSLV